MEMTTNELVNEFLFEKFKEQAREQYRVWNFDKDDILPGYEKHKHLVDCETTAIKNAECDLECGCYSCYTRDDSFAMTAHIGCDCGVELRFVYGYMWNLPDFITELDEYKEAMAKCYHDGDCC
ncbi:hypothetical protein SEA_BILLNYE_163 [Streptomyces phage BillNye]|uniref:Uncharacterized protein n=2 Tax=Wilnyevirus billnye TaxID=2560486 RepID=A0A2L1IVZ7_9CAUD|nr:hypothetical protein FDJ30_gp097 [Streptomyces phage BillNye]AVD99336.1 hypothetical protein SEA_BILLNYE_163 [Streptomyces phage BillNye]QBZ72419.1 hypothetical protein SEA_CIRCINUS_164 [Streptomyces phage Circinus]